MADSHVRKLDSSMAMAAIIAALAFACGGGAAGYFLGVRHAERDAAMVIEKLQADARKQADFASRALASCISDTRYLQNVLEDVRNHYDAELAEARAQAKHFKLEAKNLESLLAKTRR